MIQSLQNEVASKKEKNAGLKSGMSCFRSISYNPVQMSRLIIFLMLLSVSVLSFAEGRAGNGGGGLIVNGNYITIPEANISIEGHLMMDVPGLNELDFRLSVLSISPDIFRSFMPMINPSAQRSYYSVDQLDANELLEIKKVYSKILHVPLEKIVIYAVSDTKNGKTFLLPEFFKLGNFEQSSVLFHEWLWLLNPKMTYEDVLFGEKLYFDLSYNYDKWIEVAEFLSQVTGNPQIVISTALAHAIGTPTNPVPTTAVLNDNFVTCLNEAFDKGGTDQDTKSCLYDWAVGFQFVNPYTTEPPVTRAIRRYFGMGGEIAIYRNTPSYNRIPNNWQSLKLLGVNSSHGGSSLELLDQAGQVIVEINFLTMKPISQ